MRRLLDQYSVGGKGSDGLPNGERILNRYQMRLAGEDVLKEWVGIDKISDPAIDLFFRRNFENVWQHFDGFNKDAVPLSQAHHFLRELFAQAPNPFQPKKNPLSIEGSESDNVFDHEEVANEDRPVESKKWNVKEIKEADEAEERENKEKK